MAPLGRHAPDQPVRLFCQDATRLGLHWPIQRRLAGCGVKPVQVVAPLYESSWLYAAGEPTPGEAFWGTFPCFDTACFTVFLQPCGQPYADSLTIVFLAQAPAHVAQRVEVPENVVLV
jgi:hypothetical protein